MKRRLFDSPRTWFVLAGVLLLLAVLSVLEVHLPGRPRGDVGQLAELRGRSDLNLVFILIDTLRADHLSAYGYPRPTSPYIDALAAEGIRFANVESQSSWTKASMASLWTGLLPVRTGVLRFDNALPEEATLPAEILRRAGFVTAGIYRNGWVAPNFGFGQGFDVYMRPSTTQTPARFERRTPGAKLQGSDEDCTRAAIAFLDSRGHERFFLYLHYMDVHQYSYDDEAAALNFGTSYSDAYDSAIRWTDRNVGVVLGELESRGLLEKTIVVVAADHGEGFREHGLEGHGKTLYREVTHVPLVVGLPFRLDPGVVVEPMVRNVDIWPTLLDLLGQDPLPESDGRSLVPLIEAAARGTEAPPSPPALAFLDTHWGRPEEEPSPLASLRGDGHSFIFSPEKGAVGAYDLRDDPRELHNLLADRKPPPAWTAQSEAELRAGLAESPVWSAPASVELDELDRAQLRALGYVVK